MNSRLPLAENLVEYLAGKLTAGAKRALMLMTDLPQLAGKNTFDAQGAAALYRMRTRFGRAALCEMSYDEKTGRRMFCLTELGTELQEHFKNEEK